MRTLVNLLASIQLFHAYISITNCHSVIKGYLLFVLVRGLSGGEGDTMIVPKSYETIQDKLVS